MTVGADFQVWNGERNSAPRMPCQKPTFTWYLQIAARLRRVAFARRVRRLRHVGKDVAKSPPFPPLASCTGAFEKSLKSNPLKSKGTS